MNALAAQLPERAATQPGGERWSLGKWSVMLALTLTGQVGLIWLLGAHKPIEPRQPQPAPPIILARNLNDPVADLLNPVVFVLPTAHGFSGSAWAITPWKQHVSADWTEPFRWLSPTANRLGEDFQQLFAASPMPRIQVAEKVAPGIVPLEITQPFTLPSQSTLRLEGSLAGRALRVAPDLPSWPRADVLKPSTVRVIVDAKGRIVSAALETSSELAEADARALNLAWNANFEPAKSPAAGLTWGRMVFVWRTVPPPAAGESTTFKNAQ